MSRNNETATDLNFAFRSLAAVRSRPWLSQNLTNQTVNSSSTLTLPCKAMGVPHPEITWYKNGALVKDGSGKDGVDLKVPFLCRSIQSIICFFSRVIIEQTFFTFDLFCPIPTMEDTSKQYWQETETVFQ